MNQKTFFIRNRNEVSWRTTTHGVDVTISGRWRGTESEIFLSLVYDGQSIPLRLMATEASYMKGFYDEFKDFKSSPVTNLSATYKENNGKNEWEIVTPNKTKYTRAQRKLVPEILVQILPHLPIGIEEHNKIRDIFRGYDLALSALAGKKRVDEIKKQSEESLGEAKKLLAMDDFGIETLVALVSEGGDLVVLAKNMDALLR